MGRGQVGKPGLQCEKHAGSLGEGGWRVNAFLLREPAAWSQCAAGGRVSGVECVLAGTLGQLVLWHCILNYG